MRFERSRHCGQLSAEITSARALVVADDPEHKEGQAEAERGPSQIFGGLERGQIIFQLI